jgi:type II secretory pathway pseudopilin PulG
LGITNRKSQIVNRESGATLVEILVAVAIIASALVIFIAALSTGAFAVRTSDRLTTATNLAASQLETIKAALYNPGGYSTIAAPAGYTITTTSSELGAGLQQITVTVSFGGDQLVTVSNYRVNR